MYILLDVEALIERTVNLQLLVYPEDDSRGRNV